MRLRSFLTDAPTTLNPGDPITIDITGTTLRGLPATVTAIYLDRIEYRYNAEASPFAGLLGHVRLPRPAPVPGRRRGKGKRGAR